MKSKVFFAHTQKLFILLVMQDHAAKTQLTICPMHFNSSNTYMLLATKTLRYFTAKIIENSI